MKELFVCPNCNEKDSISIKSKFLDKERKKIVFYAKCVDCAYESPYYNTSNQAIDFLYNWLKEN